MTKGAIVYLRSTVTLGTVMIGHEASSEDPWRTLYSTGTQPKGRPALNMNEASGPPVAEIRDARGATPSSLVRASFL